jgi:hypothetical protein
MRFYLFAPHGIECPRAAYTAKALVCNMTEIWEFTVEVSVIHDACTIYVLYLFKWLLLISALLECGY